MYVATPLECIHFKKGNVKEYLINMICPQCGTENPANAAFCGKCGRNIGKAPVQQPVVAAGPRRFVRCSDNKSIGGVCSGAAKYFDMDVSLVRALTLISFLITGSVTFWAYIIMWLVMPEEPCGQF